MLTAILTVFMVGCDAEAPKQDAAPIIGTDSYPTATFVLTGGTTTVNEKSNPVFTYTITFDKPTNRDIDFSFVVLSGNATEHDDYDVVNATVPAFGTTATMKVMIYKDAIVEGTETLSLGIESGPSLANKYLVNPSTVFPTLNLTIQDWIFCTWILETSDTYGDGWNGGKIEVTSEGETTSYSEDNDVPTIFNIPISNGVAFSFTYVSGGGTGGAPGWESENYFKLTSPSGTVWEGGTKDYSGIPTPGVITSGTNNCP